MFLFFSSEISYSLINIEGMGSIAIFFLFRISITFGLAIYIFNKAFKNEDLEYSNFILLFFLFFLGLTLGKPLDLLYKLIYFSADNEYTLFVLKIRYISIILTMAPLIFLGFNLLIDYSSKNNELNKSDNKKLLFLTSIIIIIGFGSFIILLAPSSTYLSIILMCFHIPSLIWIIITFFYSYQKEGGQKKSYLIIIAVFTLDLILYITAIISTPSRRQIIGYSAGYIIFAETIDLIIIFIIFLGVYKEINYKKD